MCIRTWFTPIAILSETYARSVQFIYIACIDCNLISRKKLLIYKHEFLTLHIILCFHVNIDVFSVKNHYLCLCKIWK